MDHLYWPWFLSSRVQASNRIFGISNLVSQGGNWALKNCQSLHVYVSYFPKGKYHTTSQDMHSVSSTPSRTLAFQAPHWLNKLTSIDFGRSSWKLRNYYIYIQIFKSMLFNHCRQFLFVCFKARKDIICSLSLFDFYVKLKEGQNLWHLCFSSAKQIYIVWNLLYHWLKDSSSKFKLKLREWNLEF